MVVRLETIDGRHPMQDDSLLFLDFPRLFSVQATGTDWALLSRRESPLPEIPPVVVYQERRLNIGETLHIAPSPTALWLRGRAEPSRLGRARTLLYRPSMLFIVVTDTSNISRRFRMVPAAMESGLIIHPIVARTDELIALYRGEGVHSLSSLRFEAEAPDHGEFWRGVHVEISQLPGLPITLTDPGEIFVTSGLSSLPPDSTQSTGGSSFISREDGVAYLLHPDGEMAFRTRGARRFSARFGISDAAYQAPCATDGVEFLVLAENNDGHRQEIWRRFLNPLERSEDRGSLPVSLNIPEGTKRLILQTWPGPLKENNHNWDWSFWQAIRFDP